MRERSGADGGGACAGGAEGRAGAHGWRWASARARRRRLDVQASGGEWWRRGGERRRENEVKRWRLESGETEWKKKLRPAQDTYMTGGTRDFL